MERPLPLEMHLMSTKQKSGLVVKSNVRAGIVIGSVTAGIVIGSKTAGIVIGS